jgi:FKBP-type peptidyl-prolyl cis-trans isomerase FklB
MQNSLRITLLLLIAASVLPNGAAQQQAPPAQAPAAPPKSQTPPAAAPKSQSGAATKRAPAKAAPLTLKTQKEKASYALGMNFGTGLRKQSIDIDPAILARGLRDSFSNGKTLLTEDEAKAVLTQLQSDVRKRQQELAQQLGEANKKQALEFLEANKTRDGVVTLHSGLQYKVLQEGTGPKPAPTDTVVCNYRGTLLDSTEFDSSYKRGQPATFPVTGVIKGWTEVLQLMPVGSKWQLFIPSALAYGEHGAGGQIGPNATLIFEVELLSIQSKDKGKDAK